MNKLEFTIKIKVLDYWVDWIKNKIYLLLIIAKKMTLLERDLK